MNSKEKLLESFMWRQAKRFIRWVAPITLVSICLLAIIDFGRTRIRTGPTLRAENRTFYPLSTVRDEARSPNRRPSPMPASFDKGVARLVAKIDSIEVAFLKILADDCKNSSPETTN